MKTKKIEVSQIMKNIIDLGGEIMSEYSENSEHETITPEKVKKVCILIPLSNNDADQTRCEIVNIEQIDIRDTFGTSLSCGKSYYVVCQPELLRNLLLLKLYSENMGFLYSSN